MRSNGNLQWKGLFFASVTAAALLATPMVGDLLSGQELSIGEMAYAAGQGKQLGKSGAGGAIRGLHGGGAGGKGLGKGGKSLVDKVFRADEEGDDDSDRPAWAGPDATEPKPGGGSKGSDTRRGVDYGDLWVLLRDENGVPILNADGYVQPIDADGNPIPLDEEGHPLDESLVVEVELGRLNVGRSPDRVLLTRLDEAIATINAATEVSLDPAGRLVLTIDGEEKTIDSPLENMALYIELMNTGTLSGVTLSSDVLGDLAFLSDGTLTTQDFAAATSFLAAAADKTDELKVDEVVYLNSFLGIEGSLPDGYVDFSSFTYDRTASYADVTAVVLIEQADGSWVPTEVNVYDSVFNSEPFTSMDGGIDGFAQAADDARSVIEFVHEYAVPTTIVSAIN